jgi:hypothetical protein
VVEIGAINAVKFSVHWVSDEDLVSDSAGLVTEWIRIFYLGRGSSACSFVVASSVGSVQSSAQGAETKTKKSETKTSEGRISTHMVEFSSDMMVFGAGKGNIRR